MFSRTLLTAILVSAAAALYVDEFEYHQAPVSVKPEIPQAYRFYRIESLETEDDETPPIKPKLYGQDDETPPINPKQDTQASCGVTQFTFTEAGQTETLTSQRYPWDYPYNQQCSYSLTSPPGTQMTLECGTFNLACPNDQLAFSLDGGETYSSYCGRGKLALETTSGNTLLIRFTSGKSRPFSLFTRYRYKCTVKSIEGESGSGSTTTSATPVDPTPPPPAPSPSPPGSCSCGVRNINGATRIVNGVETKPGELPWRVTVFVYNPLTGRGGICGGTIISRNWVMTAAHCTMDFQPGYRINVYTGAQANPVTVGGGTKVEADRYVQHPSFNRQTLNNDISLLHLSQPLTFKSNVSPACLPYQMTSSTFSGLNVLASGWGTTKPVAEGADNNDPVSDTLLEVELPVLSTAECRAYQSVTDNMICTYKPGSDTCQGDSGGSIDYSDSSKNGRYFSIGIVSYGIGCAQEKWPGVYTKVTNYLSWIETTTQDTYCKP